MSPQAWTYIVRNQQLADLVQRSKSWIIWVFVTRNQHVGIDADAVFMTLPLQRPVIIWNINLPRAEFVENQLQLKKQHKSFPIYFTHATNMEKTVIFNRIIIRICEVSRHLWRLRLEWEENVKSLLNRNGKRWLESFGIIQKPQRTVVNTVMNLWVLQKTKELTSWVTVSFSSKILFHVEETKSQIGGYNKLQFKTYGVVEWIMLAQDSEGIL